jgi:hypothetical protein
MVPVLHGDYEQDECFERKKPKRCPSFCGKVIMGGRSGDYPGPVRYYGNKEAKRLSETGQQSGPIPAEEAR